jgi:hypothetical protein
VDYPAAHVSQHKSRSNRKKSMSTRTQVETPPLSCDQVLRIARTDAEKAYRDLSRYRIRIAEEPDGWHVDYELKDERARGGGPHYIIHPVSGEIVARRYEQ